MFYKRPNDDELSRIVNVTVYIQSVKLQILDTIPSPLHRAAVIASGPNNSKDLEQLIETIYQRDVTSREALGDSLTDSVEALKSVADLNNLERKTILLHVNSRRAIASLRLFAMSLLIIALLSTVAANYFSGLVSQNMVLGFMITTSGCSILGLMIKGTITTRIDKELDSILRLVNQVLVQHDLSPSNVLAKYLQLK